MTARHDLDAELEAIVLNASGATSIEATTVVQALWGGYGQIVRCFLRGGDARSVIAKRVRWPSDRAHPRGWATQRSHERKVRSYEVERTWYDTYASECPTTCRVPNALRTTAPAGEVVMVIEDLDSSGFSGRRSVVNATEIEACLSWLANFHATFMGRPPLGLWNVGTYWHLATRPDEFDALDPGALKTAAVAIDQQLSNSGYRTFVHGDAKLANFCFRANGTEAAAVDFQYVGGGCGMKDLAYFISSCVDEDRIERDAPGLVDQYFDLLAAALKRVGSNVDIDDLEADWRRLYPLAWADLVRFLRGWSPGHWKLNRYGETLTQQALENL